MNNFFIRFLKYLDNRLFPSRCVVCHQEGTALCPACRAEISHLPIVCPLCGQPNPLGLICPECKASDFAFDGVISYGRYENGLKTALQALKFQGVTKIGYLLGRMLAKTLMVAWRKSANTEQPLLVSVPLHPRRQRERGYNQAQLIVEGIASLTGWPTLDNGFSRLKYQASSSSLGYKHRRNQNKLYSCQTNLAGRFIFLIDDIITTGATASAAALALKRAGANIVIVATVARVS